MKYNDIEIFTCKFFTLSPEGKLQFYVGKHKGKTADDFKTVAEIHYAMGTCFWILKGKKIPLISCYLASAFLKELYSKINKLEIVLREEVKKKQKKLAKEAEESINTPGTKYGKR